MYNDLYSIGCSLAFILGIVQTYYYLADHQFSIHSRNVKQVGLRLTPFGYLPTRGWFGVIWDTIWFLIMLVITTLLSWVYVVWSLIGFCELPPN